jgi:predicted permease
MNDFKFALRSLLKSPGFTIVSVLTLAVGIGMNASMFSLVNMLLFQPVPYSDNEHLVRIYRTTPQSQKLDHSAADAVEISRECQGFLDVAAYRFWGYTLKQPDRAAVNLNALRVSASFFPVLGMKPELGRFFTLDEDRPGSSVILLSHATWQAQFGGDPAVVGQTVSIDGQATVVVGVMPEAFSSLAIWGPAEAFRPLAFTETERLVKNDRQIQLIGRYHSELSLAQLNARLAAVGDRLGRDRPPGSSKDGLRASTLQADLLGSQGAKMTWMLVGLSGFVLLIVCANLANLQLSRAMARAQEFAICSALGATRVRLLLPLLSESLLLSMAGGVCGILVALWTNDWMSSRISASGLATFKVAIDWHVLGFALAVSVAAGLVFGIVPAWLMSRTNVNTTLKSGGRGSTGDPAQHFFRNALIMGQFSLALVLLAGVGFFIEGMSGTLKRNLGWDSGRLVQCVLNLPQTRYSTPAKTYAFYQRAQERLAALPGVEGSAVGWSIPTFQFLTSRNVVLEGKAAPPAGHEPSAFMNGVTPSYLDAMGIRLVAGRNFTEADRVDTTPVAIIDESMAKALFPGRSPLGLRISGVRADSNGWAQIVGVIPDQELAIGLAAPATRFQVLLPLSQEVWNYVTIIVRARQPEQFVEPMRRVITDLDPGIPIQQLGTVERLISSVSGFSMTVTVLVAFAILGLFLSAVGLYGVIARLVVQRTPEIGIRLALGAPPGEPVWLVLRSGIRLMAIGTCAGLLGCYGIGKLLNAMMPSGRTGNSMAILLSATLLLFAVALLACWLPARRAARVDPLVALRSE